MSTLVETVALKKYYPITGGVFRRRVGEIRAVDGVSLRILKNECFGLVGESGCGKTSYAKTVIRLLEPTSGHIYYGVPEDIRQEIISLENNGRSNELRKLRDQYDLSAFRGGRLRAVRNKMQIVYQDPTRSLNPRMLVKDIVQEPLVVQGLAEGAERGRRVLEMLQDVGLTERHLYRFPHEFSGGQRQRIAIARALVTHPEFVVLDEPTSSVDVSVRAQLLDLFQKLRRELGLTYLFISHDLGVVECLADRVAVMYLGEVVETAKTADIYKEPLHPYAFALFSSIPVPDPTVRRERPELTGEVPSHFDPPPGCRFHPRCPKAMEKCRIQHPKLTDLGGGRAVACYLYHNGRSEQT